jgi:hypothetical protein
MNWDAIGAVAEAAGAIAVIATILFLARETRKNAQAIDATSSRDAAHQISEWHREVAGNPELKRILLKSTSTEAIGFTAEEWFEFRLLAISLFHIFQSHFVHQTLNVGSVELSKINIHYAQSVISSWPAWRRFWEEEVSSGTFLSGFVSAVDGPGGADYTYMATQRDIGAV